jgi:hypothetical protein
MKRCRETPTRKLIVRASAALVRFGRYGVLDFGCVVFAACFSSLSSLLAGLCGVCRQSLLPLWAFPLPFSFWFAWLAVLRCAFLCLCCVEFAACNVVFKVVLSSVWISYQISVWISLRHVFGAHSTLALKHGRTVARGLISPGERTACAELPEHR